MESWEVICGEAIMALADEVGVGCVTGNDNGGGVRGPCLVYGTFFNVVLPA